MREHLLGYLLKALEPSETERLETALDADDHLRRDLEALRRSLGPLGLDDGHIAPPDGLALRTCNYVAAHAESTKVRVPAGTRGWTMADMLVAAGVMIAASLIFFPAVSHSRYNAQLASCQNNLRQIGLALMEYSQHRGGDFPRLPTSGNEAVAGVYSTMLREAGYLNSDATLVCPGSSLAGKEFRVPTRSQLRLARGEELAQLKQTVGGSYGYNLGVMVDGRYQGVRNQSRPTFALMSDSPHIDSVGLQTNSDNHGGGGQNVLFEDGHVKFLRSCRQLGLGDDYFHNEEGDVAAGTHLDDAVIGHSATPPLGWTQE